MICPRGCNADTCIAGTAGQGRGSIVMCSKCGTRWHDEAIGPSPAALAERAKVLEALGRPTTPAPSKGGA